MNFANPAGFDRSPYPVALTDVVLRLGTSAERIQILKGLLTLRETLHEDGYIRGFQWINGSFLEMIETIEQRPPNDVDVVTFVEKPEPRKKRPSNPLYLDRELVKQKLYVDHYLVELTLPADQLVMWTAYWYSLWSHRRSWQWKGFLQIDLAPEADATARQMLDEMSE